MESSYVVKVQNKGAIRRLSLARGEGAFSYEQLQRRVRDVFQLLPSAQFGLTYVDKDGDVVTMAEDEDLKDALVLQALNPLRVVVENVNGDVKTSSPVLRNFANSDEVTEQQTVQGEAIPPTLSKPSPVESIANAEPSSNSGGNSALPEEKVSKTEEGSDVPSPASGTVADAKTEVSSEGATENQSQEEAEGSAENLGHQIHFGIQCDVCGVVPISGPRYVSRTKQNYDLCLKCHEASGAKEDEYAKIDRLFYRIGYPAYVGRMCRRPDQRMCRKPDQRMCMKADQHPDAAQKTSSTPAASADAGNKTAAETSNANSTPRVLHMGVQCDACGTVPLEGPRFKSSTRFNYDLCRGCFEKSGSNASEYSRIDLPVQRGGYPLAMRQLLRRGSPYGQLNPLSGRWVWILNRMVDEAETRVKTSAAEGSDVKVGGDAANPRQSELAAESNSGAKSAATEVVADAPVSASKQERPSQERTVDGKEDSNVVQIPVINTEEAGSTQAPIDVQTISDNSTVNNLGETAGAEETVPATSTAEGDLSTQEGLLAKLAAMGFEDPKLNGELLENNNFDLRKTLDDLCAAEEWDPILGELQEMGFYDANMNRRLMFKNNGSVKRVVKELVQMYKGEKMA